MALIKYHHKCRACGHQYLVSVINLGEHYLHGSFEFPDFHPPLRKVPTELIKCDNSSGGCGLVQLKHSVDPSVLYARYGYRSSTNATMRDHLKKIADDSTALLLKHKKDDSVPKSLDIGCNDGYLSRQYPAHFEKVGIDPCDIGTSITGIENFKFIHESFPIRDYQTPADIVTMIACFYDSDEPNVTARELYFRIKNNGILIVEVSYWPAKMEQVALDEVCHEHVCFYNFQNLEDIFKQNGLRIFNVTRNNINGGSIQLWMSRNCSEIDYSTPEYDKNILAVKFDEFNRALDTDAPYIEFASKCGAMRNSIRSLVGSIIEQNQTIHLYGASTKGNVLLQFLGLCHEQIPYASERSKEKHGGRTLGTNIQMVSEEESRAMKPDYYFVPIWSFKDEIIKREQAYLDTGGKLIFPLPELLVVGNPL